eukprot:5922193-Amphidinium_carterae.1
MLQDTMTKRHAALHCKCLSGQPKDKQHFPNKDSYNPLMHQLGVPAVKKSRCGSLGCCGYHPKALSSVTPTLESRQDGAVPYTP